jgi:hypothetical protein
MTTRTTRFYEDREISAHRGYTNEGFMICSDVAIARVGKYLYSRDELPMITPTRDGIIVVDRPESEVFSEKSMRSFEGKPVTIDHPPVDVDPSNWKDYAVGTAFNIRRTGDSLMADLLLTRDDAIRLVKSNDKTEISCGYDAKYDQVEPGHGRQYEIVGNHVAIVDNGRCGGACRIGDHAMTTSFKDKIRQAFKTRSVDELEEALKEKPADDKPAAKADDAPPAAKADEPPPKADDKPADDGGGSGGTHHHITVNVGAAGGAAADPAAAAAGAAPAAGAAAGGDPAAAGEASDPISVIVDAITALAARIDAIEQKIGGADPAADPAAVADPAAAAAAAAPAKTGDHRARTVDAAVISTVTAEFNEALSLAEILRPGVRPPTLTLDAKMDVAKTRDSICGFRRRTMEEAFDDTKSNSAFDGLIASRDEIKTMTCDSAKLLFKAASAKMRDINNAALRETGGVAKRSGGPRTIAEVNARNRAFHGEGY